MVKLKNWFGIENLLRGTKNLLRGTKFPGPVFGSHFNSLNPKSNPYTFCTKIKGGI